MDLFGGLQDLVSGATDGVSQQIDDVTSQVTENEVVQGVQEHATNATEGLGDVTGQVGESAQGLLDGFDPRNLL